MKYDYGPGMEILGEFKLRLFRAGGKKRMENVVLSLEKAPTTSQPSKTNILSLVVRTEGSKNVLYQAMLFS